MIKNRRIAHDTLRLHPAICLVFHPREYLHIIHWIKLIGIQCSVKCSRATDGRQIIRSWERKEGELQVGRVQFLKYSNRSSFHESEKTTAKGVILLYSYTPLEALQGCFLCSWVWRLIQTEQRLREEMCSYKSLKTLTKLLQETTRIRRKWRWNVTFLVTNISPLSSAQPGGEGGKGGLRAVAPTLMEISKNQIL